MTTLLVEDFGGGSNGATANNTNTAFSDGSTGTPTFDNTRAISGTQSLLIDTLGAAEYMQETMTAGATFGLRFYVFLTALPAATTYLAAMQSATTIRAQLGVNTDGTVRIRNSTILAATTTFALSTGVWWRLEWILDNGGTSQSLRVYAEHDGTNQVGGSITGTYNQGTINRLLFGTPAAATITYNTGGVKLVDTATFTDLGPAGTSAFPAPTVITAVTTIPAPTPAISVNATATPVVISSLSTILPMAGSAAATMLPDATAGTASVPTPTVAAPSSPTPARVVGQAVVFTPAQVLASRIATATPVVVTATATVPTATATSLLAFAVAVAATTTIPVPRIVLPPATALWREWTGTTETVLTVVGTWDGTGLVTGRSTEILRQTL